MTQLGPRGWTGVLVATLTITVLVPLLNLAVPPGSALHLPDFYVSLLGKILCYAICALAMDLIWGYTGILSLGHGLFFALGGPSCLAGSRPGGRLTFFLEAQKEK